MLGDSFDLHRNRDWAWEQPVQVTSIRIILAPVAMQMQCLQVHVIPSQISFHSSK